MVDTEHPERQAATTRFGGVQVLRFFAALSVVIFHVESGYRDREGALPTGFLQFTSNAGVDLFFVVSGFVIWHATNRSDPGDAGAFLYRRFTKIYMAFLPIVLLSGLQIVGTGYGAEILHIDWLKSLSLWPIPWEQNALSVSWTLSYELLFYLVIGAAILLGNRGVAVATLGVSAAVGTASTLAGYELPFEITFLTNPVIFEFLIGCGIAALLRRTGPAKQPWLWVGSGALAFAALTVVCTNLQYSPVSGGAGNIARVLAFAPPAAALVWGAIGLRAPRAVTVLGDASYVLYLIHVPVLIFTWHTLGSQLGFSYFDDHLEVAAIFIATAAIGLSVIGYLYLERPALRWLQSVWPRSRAAVPPLEQPAS